MITTFVRLAKLTLSASVLLLTMASGLTGLLPSPTVEAANNKDLSISVNLTPTPNTADKYTAVFSYLNNTKKKINIGGGKNTISPGNADQGQPKQFEVGTVERAFVVDINCEENISWTVKYNGEDIKAEGKGGRCGATAQSQDNQDGSSCKNNKGWIEDETKRTENSKTYWVANKGVGLDKVPQNSPDDFKVVTCSSLARQNYTDETGKLQTVDSSIIQKSTKYKGKKYEYQNKGNDFTISFAKNPNEGFAFVSQNKEEYIATKVEVGTQVLAVNPAVLKDNTITYPDILPNIDLTYIVVPTGLQKQVVLKNKQALDNDLAQIVFTIDAGGKTIIKKSEITESVKTLKDSEKKKIKQSKQLITEVEELSADDIASLDTVALSLDTNSPENASKPEIEKQTLKSQQSLVLKQKTEKQKLAQKTKLTNKEKQTELKRINNLPTESDDVKVGNNTQIQVLTPDGFSLSGKDMTPIAFEVTDNKYTLYPNIDELKAKEDSAFPYAIDPYTFVRSAQIYDQYTNNNGGARDTWLDSWYPNTVRGSGASSKYLAFGKNPYVYTAGGYVTVGESWALLAFDFPVGFNKNSVQSAKLTMVQYDMNADAVGCGWYCWNNFNAEIRPYYYRNGDNWFDEYGETWNNKGSLGPVYDTITPTGVTGGQIRWIGSNNINELGRMIRERADKNRIQFAITDWNRTNSGAIVCARELNAAPCNYGDRAPVLEVWYNNQPRTPVAIEPDWNDFIKKCDMNDPNSTPCRSLNTDLGQSNVGYVFGDVNDGESPCNTNDAFLRVNARNTTVSGNWYTSSNPSNGVCDRKTQWSTTSQTNGTYYYAGRNEDVANPVSSGNVSSWSNTRQFTLDSSAPVKTTDTQAPAFANNNQISLNTPTFSDNISDKFIIEYNPIINQVSQIKYQNLGGKVLGLNSTTVGEKLRLQTDNGSNLQKFSIKLKNGLWALESQQDTTKCIAFNANNTVTLEICSSNNNQDIKQHQNGQLFSTNTNPWLCLTLANGETKDNTEIKALPCESKRNQIWVIDRKTGGTTSQGVPNNANFQLYANTASSVILANADSIKQEQWTLESTGAIRGFGGNCLDWNKTNNRVEFNPCNFGANQLWETFGDQVRNKVDTARCWDVDGSVATVWGSGIYMGYCNAGLSQKFIFKQSAKTWPLDSAGNQIPVNLADPSGNKIPYSTPFHLQYSLNPSKVIDGGWYDSGALYGKYIKNNGQGYIWDIDQYSPMQSFVYTKDKEIKPSKNVRMNLDNVCLGTAGVANDSSAVNWLVCNGSNNQKWNFDDKGKIISASTPTQCLDFSSEANGTQIITLSCFDRSSQRWQVSFDAGVDYNPWRWPAQKVNYLLRYQKNNNGQWCTTSAWQTTQLFQLPNSVTGCSDTGFGNNDSIKFQVMAKDRSSGDFNNSTWYDMGTTKMDSVLPIISPGSLAIKPVKADESIATNLVSVDDKRISSTNATSANEKRKLEIKYNFVEANPRSAKVLISTRDKNNNKMIVRVLDDCKFGTTTTAPCTDLSYNFSGTNANSVTFIWDGITNGKGDYNQDGVINTADLNVDGTYEIVPFVMDQTCQDDTYGALINGSGSSKCNQSIDYTADDRFVAVDNMGANIGVSEPANEAWVNNPSFKLRGGVAGYNTTAWNAQDKDVFKLEICQVTGSTCNFQTTAFNDLKNWEFQPTPLVQGSNIFRLKSTDLAFNTKTTIGDPAQASVNQPNSQVSEWKVNYENTSPTITTITKSGNANNVSPLISFDISDPNPLSDITKVSGLTRGTNPTGYDISILRQIDTSWKEIALYKDGVNLTDTTNGTRLAGDLDCRNASERAGTDPGLVTDVVTCTIQLNNLQLDGTYKVYIRAKDLAGNEICNANYSEIRDTKCTVNTTPSNKELQFIVKSRVYLGSILPTENATTANGVVYFTGTAERSKANLPTTVRLTNQTIDLAGRYIEFLVDPSKNGSLPAEYNLANNTLYAGENITTNRLLTTPTNTVSVICSGALLDDDQNTSTQSIEVCDYSIKLNVSVNTIAGTQKINVLKHSITDSNANIKEFNNILNVDTSSINLFIKPTNNLLSPNGDNNFDSATFTVSATNPDGTGITTISADKLDIKNSLGQLVYSVNVNGGYLPVRSWNGKGNQNTVIATAKHSSFTQPTYISSNYNVNNAWVPDDSYTYSYTLTRTIASINYTTTITGVITTKTVVLPTDQVVLNSPLDNYATTRGVVVLQGTAPISDASNTWYVDLCLHPYSANEPAAYTLDPETCAFPDTKITQTSATNTGFFSIVATIPDADPATYKVFAKARSAVGKTLLPTTAQKRFSLDLASSFKAVSLIENYDGVNSASSLNAIRTSDINSTRNLKIKATVTQNTEAIDISYAKYDNAQSIPTNFSSIYRQNGRIATINETTENTGIFNPTGTASTKANLSTTYTKSGAPNLELSDFAQLNNMTDAQIAGYAMRGSVSDNTLNTTPLTSAKSNRCNQAECEWSFNYPYPNWLSGGVFEVRIRAYKGDKVEDTSLFMTVNGQIKTDPKIARIDKKINATEFTPAQYTTSSDTLYYTNSLTNKVYIEASADTKMALQFKLAGAIIDQKIPALITTDQLKTNNQGVLVVTPNLTTLTGTQNKDIEIWGAPYYVLTNTTLSTPTYTKLGVLRLDTTPPDLNSVITNTKTPFNTICRNRGGNANGINTQGDCGLFAESNKPYSINPWIKAGDAVGFSIASNEELADSLVLNEYGYQDQSIKTVALAACAGYSQEQYRSESGNGLNWTTCLNAWKNSKLAESVLVITQPGTADEGVYQPTIYLEDLAGNKSVISNNPVHLDKYIQTLDTNNKIKTATKIIYDARFTTNTSGLSTISTNNTGLLINNAIPTLDQSKLLVGDSAKGTQSLTAGYPYSRSPRTQSLDFRLFLDNTAPDRQEFVLTNWGISQKVQGTICTDTAGVVVSDTQITSGLVSPLIQTTPKDPGGFYTRVDSSKCMVMADSIGQNISTITNRTSIADAVNADSVYPELDRTDLSGIRYVSRGNTITLTARGERNQRIVLGVSRNTSLSRASTCDINGNNPGTGVLPCLGPSTSERYLIPEVSESNCSSQYPVNKVVTVVSTSTVPVASSAISSITKFREVCDIEVVFEVERVDTSKWNYSDGSQDGGGTPVNWFDFTFYPLDLAGNVPTSNPRTYLLACSMISTGAVVWNGMDLTYLSGGNGSSTGGSGGVSGVGSNLVGGTITPSANCTNDPKVADSELISSRNDTRLRSMGVVVWDDRTPPGMVNVVLGNSSPNSSLVGDVIGTDPLTRRITNDTSITVTQTGEQSADYQNSLKMERNAVSGSGAGASTAQSTPFEVNNSGKSVVRNNSNTPYSQTNYRTTRGGDTTDSSGTTILSEPAKDIAKTGYVLGSSVVGGNTNAVSTTDPLRSVRDDGRLAVDNCTTVSNSPVANRRIGVCNDGVYTVNSRQIDSSGNRGGWTGVRVERDTVSPSAPTASLSKSGNPQYGETLGLSISGEAYTQASIVIDKPDGTQYRNSFVLSSSGSWSNTDLFGAVQCGSISYIATVALTDRAGNMSVVTTSNTITSDSTCYYCGYVGSGIFALPVANSTEPDYQDFPSYREGGNHDGHDFTVPFGVTVSSVEAGIVFKVVGNKTDNYGWGSGTKGPFTSYESYLGNYVVINHNNGVYSVYGHLGSVSVAEGSLVTKGQSLGQAGSTGNSEGSHLHFQIEEENQNAYSRPGSSIIPGNVQSPFKYFTTKPSNYTDPTAQVQKCGTTAPVGGEAIDIPEDDVRITQLEANMDAARYIMNNLSGESIIERGAINGVSWNPGIAIMQQISVPPVTGNPKNGELYTKDKLKVKDLGMALNDYNAKFGNTYLFANRAIDLNQNGLYSWLVYHFVDSYQFAPKMYIHHLGNNGLQSEGGITGYDGAVVSNPYNRYLNVNRGQNNPTAFLLKNAIWGKWFNGGGNGVARVVGAPQDMEIKAKATSCTLPGYFSQNFRSKENNLNNRVFATYTATSTHTYSAGCIVDTQMYSDTFFSINKVAKAFALDETIYQAPMQDTQKYQGEYCKQQFKLKMLDMCNKFAPSFVTSNGNAQIIYDVTLGSGNSISNYSSGPVWILTHGWNDNNEGPLCQSVGANIRAVDNTATTICIDWGSIANTNQTLSDLLQYQGPQPEALMIDQVAQAVQARLNEWRGSINLKDNLYIVGHSLGSILGAQISSYMNGSKYLLALAPPGKGINANYAVGHSSGELFDTFQNDSARNFIKAQFVRSVVSQNTWADNPVLASTADESILVDYTTLGSPIDKHSGYYKSGMLQYLLQNSSVFTRANTPLTQYAGDNGFTKALHKNDYSQNYSAFISQGNAKPNYIKVKEGLLDYTVYGTDLSDTIDDTQFSGKIYSVKSGTGNDTLSLYPLSSSTNTWYFDPGEWSQNKRVKMKGYYSGCEVTVNTQNLVCGGVTNLVINGVSANDLKLKWEAFKNPGSVPNSAGDRNTAQALVGNNLGQVIFE